MAHPNIEIRRDHVKRLLDKGPLSCEARERLSQLYRCSVSAILADITFWTRPKTKETPFTSPNIRRQIYARDGKICQYCGVTEANQFIIEHVVPIVLGGVGRPYNLVVACQKCNVEKGSCVWLPSNFEQIVEENQGWREFALNVFHQSQPVENAHFK